MNNILEQVNSVCTVIRNSIKYPTTFNILLSKTRKVFKSKNFDLKIKTKRQPFLNHEEFYVNAYYDADDDKHNETPIEVLIYHNFDKNEIWDTKQTSELLVQIFDAVIHEYRHQRQSRSRKYLTFSQHPQTPYREYLLDPDELDAYALSIAIELCRNLGKFRALRYMQRLSYLSKFKIQNRFVSPNLNAYVQHFGGVEHPVIKRLSKKVYIRLKKIDIDYVFV